MLRGETIQLRTVREADLDGLHASLSDLGYRGSFFPLGLQSETVFRRTFEEDGFWGRDEGMLLMVDGEDRVVGEIEFYPITHYMTGYGSRTWCSVPSTRGRGSRPRP